MFQIGNIDIHPINAGVVWMDSGGSFGLVPRALWSQYLQPDDQHRVPMVLTCLLVRAGCKTILVDTGYGDKLPDKLVRLMSMEYPRGTLIDGLARLGVAPEDVDIVIDTHLHGDHCGGNTTFAPDRTPRATFPNAEYMVQRREFEDAMQPNERTRATYLPVNYEPLAASGQLTLLDGDTDILPGISGVVTPGHTPGHQCVLFERGGQRALFVADMASFAVHFERLAWMTAYDVEPLVTLETKRRWRQWALDTGALLIFQHDTQVLAGHFVQDEHGGQRVQPVEAAYA
ncbi:MAG: MBL fold metallo-hydrolase [Anaerolineae bacterium]|nr:MBL fold metallo-hydrolase [Anaerolineae bacterium]